jgi:bifunctional non-homologous end joining protein LigD
MTAKLTHLDKLYWKSDKITKGDLIEYYEKISRYILPYLKNRPCVMHRYPDGVPGIHFYQKDTGKNLPRFVKTSPIQHAERKINYLEIQNKQSLLYAANLGSIELHTIHAPFSRLKKPDYLIFDLDPTSVSFDAVIETAKALHEIFDEIRVPSFCKTSGATGLHIYIPLHGKYDYDQVKPFASLVAILAHRRLPSLTSLERSPAKRQKKVYIDIGQNHATQMVACPYSVRGKPHAPVSTPLSWKEVKRGLDPVDFTIKTVPRRLASKGDIFKKVLGRGIDLNAALKRLDRLS